jgi:hypothetical protein
MRRRIARAALLIGTFAFAASAAAAEPYVLVYSEGSVVSLPGGAVVSKGQQVDGVKFVQLGPADFAIFVSQAGNVVHRDGPYCGPVADPDARTGGGMFGLDKSPASAAQGCQK